MSQDLLGDRRGEEVPVRGRWQGLLRVRSEISHYAAQKRVPHKATGNKGWVGKKGEVRQESDITTTKIKGRKSHLATGPDEDDGRDASGR